MTNARTSKPVKARLSIGSPATIGLHKFKPFAWHKLGPLTNPKTLQTCRCFLSFRLSESSHEDLTSTEWMWSSTTVNDPHAFREDALAPAPGNGSWGESSVWQSARLHGASTPPPKLPLFKESDRGDGRLDRIEGELGGDGNEGSSSVLGSNICRPAKPICDRSIPCKKLQGLSKRKTKARRNLGTFSKKAVKSRDMKGSMAGGQDMVKEAISKLEISPRSTRKFMVSEGVLESLRHGHDDPHFQKTPPGSNVEIATLNVTPNTEPCAQVLSHKLRAKTNNREDSCHERRFHDKAITSMSMSHDRPATSMSRSSNAESAQLTMGDFEPDEAQINRSGTHKETFPCPKKMLREAVFNNLSTSKPGNPVNRGAQVLDLLLDRLHFTNEESCRSNLEHQQDQAFEGFKYEQPSRLQARTQAGTNGSLTSEYASYNSFISSGEVDQLGGRLCSNAYHADLWSLRQTGQRHIVGETERNASSNPAGCDRQLQIQEILELPYTGNAKGLNADKDFPFTSNPTEDLLGTVVRSRYDGRSDVNFEQVQADVGVPYDPLEELLTPQKEEALACTGFESILEFLSPKTKTSALVTHESKLEFFSPETELEALATVTFGSSSELLSPETQTLTPDAFESSLELLSPESLTPEAFESSLEYLSPETETSFPVTFQSCHEVLISRRDAPNLDHMLIDFPQVSVEAPQRKDMFMSLPICGPLSTSFQPKSPVSLFDDLQKEEIMGMEGQSVFQNDVRLPFDKWDEHFKENSWEGDNSPLSPTDTDCLNDPWSSPKSNDWGASSSSPLLEFDIAGSGSTNVLHCRQSSFPADLKEFHLDDILSSPGPRTCSYQNFQYTESNDFGLHAASDPFQGVGRETSWTTGIIEDASRERNNWATIPRAPKTGMWGDRLWSF